MPTTVTAGVDIGGTKVEIALVDAGGRIVASTRTPSGNGMDPASWVSSVKAALDDLCRQTPDARLKAMGVGFAGQIDARTGVVLGSPNVGWSDVPLLDMLRASLGLPVTLVNDVQAATWAEWKIGAGQGLSHLMGVFVGTGIGGGLVLDGKLYRGAGGSAGELGHTVLDKNGPFCKCGRQGCLEAHAGGWAIAVRAQEAVGQDRKAGRALLARVRGDSWAITAATVSEAAHSGDAFAQTLVRRIGEDLGAGIASAVNAFNPEMVILGGGVIEGMPELVDIVGEVVAARSLSAAASSLRIERARLGNLAGVIGAALMAQPLALA